MKYTRIGVSNICEYPEYLKNHLIRETTMELKLCIIEQRKYQMNRTQLMVLLQAIHVLEALDLQMSGDTSSAFSNPQVALDFSFVFKELGNQLNMNTEGGSNEIVHE